MSLQTKKNYLLIVESPAKAKTISNYLKDFPDQYTVVATYGHIRGLPKKTGSVLPDKNFEMIWERLNTSEKHINTILEQAKRIEKNGAVILATDSDREGEAIAWHVSEVLKEKQINCQLSRITFQEITKKSIEKALSNLGELNRGKIDSYFARLSLDYLVGFGISPILWAKMRGCKSAGRVQSAALRSIVERELEILAFQPQKYWDFTAEMCIDKHCYESKLVTWEKQPVTKFMWTEESAKEAKQKLLEDTYKVTEVKHKTQSQAPNAPFTTSTLQQEASHRLGFKPAMTMQLAQKLYEGMNVNGELVGMITYMRTDSMRIDDGMLDELKQLISSKYGVKYSHKRDYAKKNSKVQDAHEAIRPTSLGHSPDQTKAWLDENMQKLYQLIWDRTVASQMSNAEFKVTNVIVSGQVGAWKVHLRERTFDGFHKLTGTEEEFDSIPDSFEGPVNCKKIDLNEHTTIPPPRFTEAALIKHLDEVGIGRPSTYVSVMETLQKRQYIQKNGKQLIPMETGIAVTGFLKLFCSRYIQDDFTAQVEVELDKIAQGELKWQTLMNEFWTQFSLVLTQMSKLDARGVAADISDLYQLYFFHGKSRECQCGGKKICCMTSIGIFIGCSRYPDCTVQEPIQSNSVQYGVIGQDPTTGENIVLKNGPYGHYLRWEESRTNLSVPAKLLKTLDLPLALRLKTLPKSLGVHPFTGKEIKLHVGQYLPYLSHNGVYTSCRIENFWDLTFEEAMTILGVAEKKGTSTNKKTTTSPQPKRARKKAKPKPAAE